MRRVAVAAGLLLVARNTRVVGNRTQGFVRVFGYGVHWKDVRRSRLLFSERNGYTFPTLVVGPWWLTTLRRNRLRNGRKLG